MQKKKEPRYAYPLKLENHLKAPLMKVAADHRRKINDEINIAVEQYIASLKTHKA